MGRPPGAIELQTSKENGHPKNRYEMETWLRDNIQTAQEKRLKAIEMGLPAKVAYDMKLISVIHWILDRLIDEGRVEGDKLEVSSDLGFDNNKDNFDQFTQRLAIFIENGQAATPIDGEGIDMTKMNTPPAPPIPGQNQNGTSQNTFVPPTPPPMGAQQPPQQQGSPQPPAPPAPPSPGGQQPGQQPPQPSSAAPQPPSPPVPGVPAQQGTAPQPPMPAAPSAPQQSPQPPSPQGAPMPPTAQPPQQQQAQPQGNAADPGPPPTKADPNRPWGEPGMNAQGEQKKRRNRKEVEEDNAFDSWVAACANAGIDHNERLQQANPAPQQPQQMQQARTAPPNPMAGATGPAPTQQAPMPTMGMPQMGTPPNAGPAGGGQQADNYDLEALREEVAELNYKMDLIGKVTAQTLRVLYSKPGDPTPESILQELGLSVPTRPQ